MMKSIKNVADILERKSFPEFLEALDYHVDIKEWSEVGGVYKIVRMIMQHYNPDIVFDIGCGKRPTLGTVLALNYKQPVFCIDPILDASLASKIRRLYKYNDTLDEWLNDRDRRQFAFRKKALICANHSHSSKTELLALTKCFEEWVLVTVPCCVDNRLNEGVALHMKDRHMHTPKNDIYIWASDTELLKKLI